MPQNHRDGGTSLAKVGLVLAIAAVTTMAGLPAFRDYGLRMHRRMAAAVLLQAQANWRQREQAGPAGRLVSLGLLGLPGPTVYLYSDGSVHAEAAGSPVYRIDLAAAGVAAGTSENCGLAANAAGGGFVLVAQPLGVQQADRACAYLCLSASGTRGASGPEGAAACWRGRS